MEMLAALAALSLVIVAILVACKASARAERDARYFEWWLRSIEERKEDRRHFDDESESWQSDDPGDPGTFMED